MLGQITEVESTYASNTVTVADSITYEPFGPLKALTFGNGLALARTFDQQYRLTKQTTGTIQDLTFTHDAAGNIDAIVDAVQISLSQDFTQDALHRIDFEEGGYGVKDYTYDEVGNRLTRVHDDGSIETQTLTYVTDSDRLATHDGNTVTLDAAGNTSADPTLDLSFTYDDHNRMVEAYAGAVLQATYVYNGHGQRVKKVEATGAQRTLIYHYGLAGELIGETIYSSAGAKIGERDYLWLDSLPIAQSERVFSGGVITSEQFVYLHADHLETPRLATNGSGTVVWRWDSDAFGVGDADSDPNSDTNLVNVRLRFPGQYFDEETGLHYNYFRDYDPRTGRYGESDPIGLAGGLNGYSYGSGNPLRYIDPLGLEPFSEDFWDAYLYYGKWQWWEVWEEIGGNVGRTYREEEFTCAARVSYGLNYGGEPIPAGIPGGNRNYGGDNMRYIISTESLRNYLQDHWGPPDVQLRTLSDLRALEDRLVGIQAAIAVSEEHVAVIRSGYHDPYVEKYLGDAWILPVRESND